MKINNECNFVLENVYEYDFDKCHYNLLKLYGYDVSNIPVEDKLERNISIGKIRRNNKELSEYLQNETNRLIDHYLDVNEIGDKELIVRLFDGFIVTRKLKDVSSEKLELKLRNIISKFIISIDRKKFMKIIGDGEVIVKGLSDRCVDDSYFNLFKNLNFTNKQATIDYLDNIRYKIFHGKNIEWYIRMDEDDDILIPIVGEGLVKTKKSLLGMFGLDDIDKKYLWNNYLWPFVKSVVVHLNC